MNDEVNTSSTTCVMVYCFQKLREYLLGTSRIARLDAKREHIRQTLIDSAMSLSSSSTNTSNASPSLAPSTILESRSVIRELSQLQASTGGNLLQPPASKPPRRKRIGRLQTNGQPKLFGGSLEEYLEATNQDIPLIIKSCIRVINLYGKWCIKVPLLPMCATLTSLDRMFLYSSPFGVLSNDEYLNLSIRRDFGCEYVNN